MSRGEAAPVRSGASARLPPLLAAVLFVLAALFFSGSAALAGAKLPPTPPALKLTPRQRIEPPMRIVRVMSSDPSCRPNCPEWISAQGRIMPGSGAAFAKVVADLNGRRLPVLISSPGGSLIDAVAMGKLIRERRLAVAVARTLLDNCPERASSCPDAVGQAITGGARCASACPLILAGGVERLVGPVPLVGVHQITLAMKETEGAVHLTRIKKVYEPIGADEDVEAYLKAMGIGDPVMTLLRKTPASSIRWLSLPELRSSRLATLALDAADPIAADGANGLNAHGFDGAESASADFRAHGQAPFAGGALEASLIYARGGGIVALALSTKAASGEAAPWLEWTLAFGGQSLPLKPEGAAARAEIPRDRFCAGARGGATIATVEGDSGEPPKAAFDLARLSGAAALIDEACPEPGA